MSVLAVCLAGVAARADIELTGVVNEPVLVGAGETLFVRDTLRTTGTVTLETSDPMDPIFLAARAANVVDTDAVWEIWGEANFGHRATVEHLSRRGTGKLDLVIGPEGALRKVVDWTGYPRIFAPTNLDAFLQLNSLVNSGRLVLPQTYEGSEAGITRYVQTETGTIALGLLALPPTLSETIWQLPANIFYRDQAILDGTLELFGTDLAPADLPGDGETFTLIRPAGGVTGEDTLTGTFDQLVLVDLPGRSAELTYYPDHVDVTFYDITAGFGDYNASGQVEQGDLDLVLQNWGLDTDATSGGAIPAGWTNDLPDGLIDQGELDGVLLNWGVSAVPAFNGASVPEPALVGEFCLALATGCRSRREAFSRDAVREAR